MSTAPTPSTSTANRHALSAVDKQKMQLDKLLKDPAKPAFIPPPPKEKSIRPAREMMKNVQGSSAGAGSGEFHVYKAGRRREYERLKMLDDQVQKETDEAEFAARRREIETVTEAKTAKNRAKRQKKKERSKATASDVKADGEKGCTQVIKKRRLVNGKELVFRRPGEESDAEDTDDGPGLPVMVPAVAHLQDNPAAVSAHVVPEPRITIHEDD